jgi:hypothetical protein
LNASGIFYASPPPFDGSTVRRHRLKALTRDEQKLFVSFWIEQEFRKRKDAGIQEGLRHLFVIDEAHLFMSESDEGGILDKVAVEGRKFSCGLLAASQSPTHFSTDFLTNCAVTILLGVHSQFWEGVCRKLKITEDLLTFTKPRETGAIKLQRIGETNAKFKGVILDEKIITDYAKSFRKK